jgi:two-component system OmpR family sensor kinase
LLIAGLWIAAAIIAVFVGTSETNKVFDNALEGVADAIALLSPKNPSGLESDAAAQLEEVALERTDYVTFQIRTSSGEVLHRSSRAPAAPYPISTAPGFSDNGSVHYYTRPLSDGAVIQVAEESTERRRELLRLIASFLLPLLGLLIAAFLLATRLATSLGSSLADVTAQIRLRDAQSLNALEREGLPLELQPVVDDLNLMFDRLKRALEAERSFSAMCAHELRNPIAAARAQADLVAEKLEGGPEHARLEQLSQVLARLGRYIERLLQFNRAEAGFSRSGTSSDLAEVTRHLIDEYALRPASANRMDFDDAGIKRLPVAIDQDALAIAISNLLDNAIAYSDPNSEIHIRLSDPPQIEVTNDAPVFTSAQLARLTQRFSRGERSGQSGFGLGLSIVQEIITQAGGRLELRSPARGRKDGFQALLHLPPASQRAEPESATAAHPI